jgi:hypothetical protein
MAVVVGSIHFVLTSFSDPGTVTNENVSQNVSSYPYDNIIYVEKECSTCKITRYILLITSSQFFLYLEHLKLDVDIFYLWFLT